MENIYLLWLQTIMAIIVDEYAFPFLLLAFMVKCLLISFYCLLIYWVVRIIKHIWGRKMTVRANYYIWYLLLLCFPLSRLRINHPIKLSFYDLFLGIYNFPGLSLEGVHRIIMILNPLRLLLFIATFIWLVVTLVKCLRQAATNIVLQRAIRRKNTVNDNDGFVQKAAEAFKLHPGKIQVVPVDFVRSPVSYGVFYKTILLPDDYENRYTLSERYLLLLHEMGHIKNHDTVKIQLLEIIECFVWPLRLMKKHFVRDSEILCDNRVLGVWQGEQDIYGELLVQECSTQHVVKGLSFSNSYHTLKSRLDAIYSRKPEKHRLAAFTAVLALLMAGSFVYAYHHPAAWLKTRTNDQSTYFEDLEFTIGIRYIDGETGATTWRPAQNLPLATGMMEQEEWLLNIDTLYQALSSTHHFTGNQLMVDKSALYAYLQPYIEEGLHVTQVFFTRQSAYYIDTGRESMVWGENTGGTATIDKQSLRHYFLDFNELVDAVGNDPYVTFTVPPMTWDERTKIFAAYWL